MKKHSPSAVPLRAQSPAHWLGLLFGLMLLSLLALPVWAADAVDPPDRVGRLSEVDGKVWIFAADINEWIPAVRNRPVTSGDRLSTEADGRAEVRIGSSVLRIAPNTELDVQQLDDVRISLQLQSGSVTARLRTQEAATEFSLVTQEGRFRTDAAGNYRFDRIGEISHATALSGQAAYEGDGTALAVMQGQHVEFWMERGVAQYSISNPQRDDFGTWVAARDASEERGVSTRYVSPEMTGVEDLDRYGAWEQTTEYGAIWTPRVVVSGWAPYRMGHWAWVSPWGWTWVDDAPWGFAPFHYGRWVHYRNNWCWAPGRYVARPVYAPALVAWVGGSHGSVSISVGRSPTVGWFPLAPREIYVPGYRVSPRYVRNVNVTHVTNITNVNTIINNPTQYMAEARYVNRGLPRAVTVVPSTVIERRQPVAPAITRVNDQVMREMVYERPRAVAPVKAPPRWEKGIRPPAADPRTARPGYAPTRPVAGPDTPSATPPRGNGNGSFDRGRPPQPALGTAPAPRWQETPRPGYGGRENTVIAPSRQQPLPGSNALPQVNQPGWATPPSRGTEMRTRPQPPMPPRETAPDRALAPPRADERKRHHEMPGPPPVPVQAPQMRAPQMPAPQIQSPRAQPPQMQAPRQVEAPPTQPVLQNGREGNGRVGQPPAQQQQREGRSQQQRSYER
jgi:hypothetical protein